ncbi:MAG TPA: phytoene/squalene synthase family protein [Tepidisphaeraceae bacterium]|jgi:phytoene synthase
MSLLAPPTGEPRLAQSRAYCEQLTRQAAKNFYYGLRLLPEPKRSAMFALYAYMRLVDDIADEEDGRDLSQRQEELDAWQMQTKAILDGQTFEQDDHPLWPAFAEVVQRHKIPGYIFDEVIEGQRQDLVRATFETFDDLRTYCYRVAGVIGLASIYIWGFEGGAAAEALAVDRGVAFQLTNILRDLREDAERGRCYLPRQELVRFNVTDSDLKSGRASESFTNLLRFQIERAESLYTASSPLEGRIERDSRPTLRAMTDIYHGLLTKIAADPQRVLTERVSLSVLSKLRIGWRAVRAK